MRHFLHIFAIALVLVTGARGEERVYKAPSDFIRGAFGGKLPPTSVLKLSDAAKARAKNIMQHDYREARVRYWTQGARTVWILEEIGKNEPITTGFIIEKGHINSVEILVYRESHGWEVTKPFFTHQFQNATLKGGDRLSNEVRNIAGATLSVRAITKLSRLALYLDTLK